MKFYIIPILTVGVAFGLERPVPGETTGQEKKSIDMRTVKPLPITEYGHQELQLPVPDSEPNLQPAAEETVVSTPSWLGVFSDNIDDTLMSHLGLTHGVVLRKVEPTSPAALAGLKVHDILQSINDQPITGQRMLKSIIQSIPPEEVIAIQAVSQGESKEYTVTLQPLPMERAMVPKRSRTEPSGILDQLFRNRSRVEESASVPKRSFGKLFNRLLEEATPENFNLNLQMTNSVMVSDDDGSVEIQTVNGEKNVVVRDHDGNVQYEGAWNTDDDMSQAPPEVRERVESVNFNFHDQSFQLNTK